MPGYIVLQKFTQKGLSSIKDMPASVKQSRANAEQAGFKIVGVWLTMGEYDMAIVVDAPDDQAIAAGVLRLARDGYATSVTMRAFSEDEFAQVVGKLP